MWFCRCGIEPVVCFLDEWAHRLRLPHWLYRWLCDRHEFNMTGIKDPYRSIRCQQALDLSDP
jgi:hypothetical protein